jgi:hypothetical protein
VTRRVCAVRRKRRIFGYADIFVGGDRSGFGFGAGIGKEPTGQAAGEAPGNACATCAARACCRGDVAWRSWSWLFFHFRLRLMIFRLDGGRRWSGGKRLSTIFRQRLAGEKNRLFGGIDGSGGASSVRSVRGTMVKTALCWTARFEATRLATAIFGTALVAAAVFVAAGFVATGFAAALRRSVLGGREIASAYCGTLRASATMASTAPAEASTATITATISAAVCSTVSSTITAAVCSTVSSTITAAAKVLSAAITAAAGTWRVILRGIVVGRKILRSGSVGFRLAFFGIVMGVIVQFGGMSAGDFVFGNGLFDAAWLHVVRAGIVMRRGIMRRFVMFVVMGCLVTRRFVGVLFSVSLAVSFVGVTFLVFEGGSASERFTGKQFDGVGRRRRRKGWRCGRGVGVRVAVIVVFEIFEDIADVEEGIAIEADIHERRLHAGEDAGDFAFVDAADEGELFFALDVNFD